MRMCGFMKRYNKDQLEAAILKVLSDERLRIRFGEGGRRLVWEEFRWDNVVRKMEGIYETASAK